MKFLATVMAIATSSAFVGCGLVGSQVNPGEVGVKYVALDEPALEEEPRPEGFYYQWPWNSMVKYPVIWQSREEKLEVLTADDLHIPVTGSVTYRPVAQKIRDLHAQIGPSYYDQVIRPVFMTLLRSEVAHHKHNDLARESPTIEEKVLAKLRQTFEEKPFEIGRVSITHIDFDRGVTKAISDKVAKQQLSEQKKFELEIAEREAEIARAKARGESDVSRIRAEGEAQAIILRGKAQAEAQEAVGKTLTPAYIQYKAFENPATRYYFVPLGKDGLPLFFNGESPQNQNR